MENIDQTQWINPRKVPLVNAHRMAKNDIDANVVDGHMISAQVENKKIGWLLVNMGFIEECNYYTAMVFLDLRRAYEASQGVKWRSLGNALQTLGLSAGEANDLYDEIKHEIGLPRAIRIFAQVIEAMNEDGQQIHEAAANAYRTAFDSLMRAMQTVNKKRREREENALAHI